MSPLTALAAPLPPAVPETVPIGGGETAAFWALATIMVLAALGVVFMRKPVYSALLLAVVMISLAVLYGIQQAPFLMVVQIIVYTGAVLMLFLFVVMLIGVSSADSLVETLPGQRVAGALIALGFVAMLVFGLTDVVVGDPAGLGAAGGEQNLPALAGQLFGQYVIAFEATGALLITAVLGALVLAFRERTGPKVTQRQLSQVRIRGPHPSPLPGPGTYARHNAIDMPALLPDGSTSELSVNPVLAARAESAGRATASGVDLQVRAGSSAAPGDASDSTEAKEARAEGEETGTGPVGAAGAPGAGEPRGGNDSDETEGGVR
ncbi:NADH-quinone oxidoreductase subunit J [Allonocardiopsis opalescens]|uniref:NADH-quinone oxidoreductase subunit J n=1 Tax=Allonocardiopsis opalescens TaxID=1144618 RepID=A0A2T0Q804_9ACTN|nr:NADH-quinone oxidoreductase subunit J [Allonocardiopsis opalescens]PRX99921.1 NADH dehydrogenase subunit J [Allonocardiopsis opalescens]